MSYANAIAFGLDRSAKMLNRFCSDLTPAELLHRPVPKANCAAWLLGHLTLSERRILALLGGEGPALPEGFEKRFSRDAGAPEATDFGDTGILLPLFNEHRNRLIEKVRATPSEVLDKPVEKPHPMFGTLGEMASFFAIHTSVHAGQITTIRRSLGHPPVI